MLKVYNTMTRKKEEFHPIRDGEVSIYCCGVTPYNHPHIGNARPFVTWDVIRRYFTALGYRVRYVQNFTDIDDKIIRTANEEGVTWKDISDGYIKSYFESMSFKVTLACVLGALLLYCIIVFLIAQRKYLKRLN